MFEDLMKDDKSLEDMEEQVECVNCECSGGCEGCGEYHESHVEEEEIETLFGTDVYVKRMGSLKLCKGIACQEGLWNYDHYSHGFANGLILALAIMEGKTPKYLSAPEQWLCYSDDLGLSDYIESEVGSNLIH